MPRITDSEIERLTTLYDQRGQYDEPSQAERENFTQPKEDRKEMNERSGTVTCDSCGYDFLDGLALDCEVCNQCGQRLCVACKEMHLKASPRCPVVAHIVDLSRLINEIDDSKDLLEVFLLHTETSMWSIRNQRDALLRERGDCTKSGHLWDEPPLEEHCVLCDADKTQEEN